MLFWHAILIPCAENGGKMGRGAAKRRQGVTPGVAPIVGLDWFRVNSASRSTARAPLFPRAKPG